VWKKYPRGWSGIYPEYQFEVGKIVGNKGSILLGSQIEMNVDLAAPSAIKCSASTAIPRVSYSSSSRIRRAKS